MPSSGAPGPVGDLVGVAVLFGLLWLYLLPAWIAKKRKHHNAKAIFWLNLLLGWSLIGWAGALVWALVEPPVVVVADVPARLPVAPRSPCPYCAEPILPAAAVCRFCTRELPAGWAGPGRREPRL
jgi:Superinfection immunity protein